MATLNPEEIARYARHLVMPEVTMAGQLRLKQARVLCVGAGGLGSPLTLYLAAAGVGTLGLVEFDTVDLSNIQRQILYSNADVGRAKLDAACERLRGLNPQITVVGHPLHLAADNVMDLVRDYDIVVDGSDNFATRYLINDACVLAGRADVSASIYRFEGQLSVFDARHGPCYRCLFPEPPPPGMAPSCAEAGVLGVLPGIVGSMQAMEVIKLILGNGAPLLGRMLLIDALAGEYREVRTRKDPQCRVCGPNPSILAPVDYTTVCADDAVQNEASAVPLISVEQFAALRASGNAPALIDVRDAHEWEIVKIPDTILMSLGELLSRLDELDPAQDYTITCHLGGRSKQAYRVLRDAGFERVQVLDGGVDAWADRIDPALPRY